MTDPSGTVYHAATEHEAMELQLAGYTRQSHQQRAYVPEPDAQPAERAYVPPEKNTPEQAAVAPVGGDTHPADAVGRAGETEQRRRRS